MADSDQGSSWADRAKQVLSELANTRENLRRDTFNYAVEKGMDPQAALRAADRVGSKVDRTELVYGMNPYIGGGMLANAVGQFAYDKFAGGQQPEEDAGKAEGGAVEGDQSFWNELARWSHHAHTRARASGGSVLSHIWEDHRTHMNGGGQMPSQMPGQQPQNDTIASIIKRGQPIPPQAPHPTPQEQQAALADTRTGGDIVAKRLNVLVPERDRVADGQYAPGAPGGGRWADMPEEVLNRPGVGFNVTDDELNTLWQDAVNRSSAAAKAAVERHDVKPRFYAKDWDKAMRLPLRDHLWYELSGEKMAENLPELTPKEFMHGMDLVGATSARAKPGENLERALSVLSQHMRGVPVDVDLTIPETARQALSRSGSESSALPGNKTGYFSDTLALAGGVPTRIPISVNDVWVGRMFGVPDDVMSGNQSLHEPMSIYFNNIRDLYNERHGHELPFKYQSWNFQAPAWVHLRGEEAGEESGDAYHQVWGGLINKLNRAGIPGINGDKITREALMHPGFADALRTTTKPFRDAPKATIEFGTTQTNVGKTAHDLYKRSIELGDQKSQDEYLKGLTTAMYASGRGKGHPWERLKKAITGVLGVESDITRIASPTSESPLDIGGSFEGAISPNIRIPLKGMTDRQIEYFNAVAGKHLKQDAMAASRVLDAEHGSEPRDGHIRGHSVFVPTTEGMDPADIRRFGEALDKEGHSFSYARYPNGYRFDVNPYFGPDEVRGADEDLVSKVYKSVLEPQYGPPKILAHDYASVYTERSDYDRIKRALTSEIKNDFIKEAGRGGITPDQARAILKKPDLSANVTGRGKKAWDRLQTRLDHLANAEAGFKALADRVSDSHAGFIERAQKRHRKLDPSQGFARGGRAFGLHPVHKIPGVHIVTADAGEPIFTGEK